MDINGFKTKACASRCGLPRKVGVSSNALHSSSAQKVNVTRKKVAAQSAKHVVVRSNVEASTSKKTVAQSVSCAAVRSNAKTSAPKKVVTQHATQSKKVVAQRATRPTVKSAVKTCVQSTQARPVVQARQSQPMAQTRQSQPVARVSQSQQNVQMGRLQPAAEPLAREALPSFKVCRRNLGAGMIPCFIATGLSILGIIAIFLPFFSMLGESISLAQAASLPGGDSIMALIVVQSSIFGMISLLNLLAIAVGKYGVAIAAGTFELTISALALLFIGYTCFEAQSLGAFSDLSLKNVSIGFWFSIIPYVIMPILSIMSFCMHKRRNVIL